MSEGTVEDVPPSYNEQAPTAPPAYNPSSPASKQITSQLAVQYVDQNGNPVNPPTTANVKYVDQYGNPVNPPPTAQQPTVNVKYVDQYGNPVAAPKTVQQPTANCCCCCRNIKQQKTASFFLGGIALLILFIGIFVDSLASHTMCIRSCGSGCCDETYTCGWTELTVECDEDFGGCCSGTCMDLSFSYGDNCDVSPSWCGTQASALISLVTMLISTIMCVIGVIFVQPWYKLTSCCCARVSFICSLCFGILTLIIWFAGDGVCLGSSHSSAAIDKYDEMSSFQYINMTIGGSMICDIIAMIFVLFAAIWGVN